MDRIRIGVAGAGYISTTYHCPSLVKLKRKFPGLELAAICDTNGKAAADAAAKYGFAAHYTDSSAMLSAETLDAALVLVPPPVMQKVGTEFMRRKLPVLLEKPPAESSDGIREMIVEQKKSGKPAVVAFNRRFMSLSRQAREIIDRMAEQGRPAYGCTAQIHRYRRTEQEFAYGTGVHSFDLMRYLLGDVAEVATRRWKPQGTQAHSYLVDFIYKSGVRATLAIMPESGIATERYEIHGPDWSLVYDASLEWTVGWPGKLSLFQGPERHQVQDNNFWPEVFRDTMSLTGFLGENEHFLNCVLGRETPAPDLADCLQSLELGEVIQEGGSRKF
jgi:myo-inositol 2-dehydrogenase/D-chiro-inositol 1-dehydrogenase